MNPGTDLPDIPPRPRDAHKGSMGRVVLVAGSRGMAGAALMASESALRSGAGYLVVALPGGLSIELTASVPSAVQHLCGGAERDHLGIDDLGGILSEVRRGQSLAVGPGLGAAPDTGELVRGLLAASPLPPTVVDADGLNHLGALSAHHRLLPPECVLTPHPGEAARLLGWDGAGAVQADRRGALETLVGTSGAVVLLKGADTLVGAPDGAVWTNATGNPGMAKAGSGDVLTGLVAALLARGLSPWDAARLGAHLHGRAGDLAAAALGEESLLATDLIGFLPEALREHPRAPC